MTYLRAIGARLGERGILFVIALVALTHGVAYALTVPPWQAPDEPGHFEHVYLMVEQRRLFSPVDVDPALEREIIASLYANHYWDYVPHGRPADMPEHLGDLNTFAGSSRTLERPSLSYLPYALVLAPIRHQDVDFQLRALRLSSVLYLAVIVGLVWAAARALFPASLVPAVVAAAFAALLPQHAYIMASVSDGNLTEVLASAGFLVMARSARFGLNWRRALALGLLSLLSLTTKNTALFLLPTMVVAMPVLVFRGRIPRWELAFAGAGAVALALMGARFAPRSVHLSRLWSGVAIFFSPEAYSPDRLADYQRWIGMTFESFWGRFGWMNIRMAGSVYLGLTLVSVAMVAALIWRLATRRPQDLLPGVGRCLVLYGLAVGFAAAFVLGTFVVYYSPYGNFSQGRYVFPALLPMAVLVGYSVGGDGVHRSGRHLAAIAVGVLLLLAAYALLATVAPTFGR